MSAEVGHESLQAIYFKQAVHIMGIEARGEQGDHLVAVSVQFINGGFRQPPMSGLSGLHRLLGPEATRRAVIETANVGSIQGEHLFEGSAKALRNLEGLDS